ncbi:PDZ domain-containing protein [Patescibacteria group bacterium]|nr:MAG: PDZ domain-containing protein [Patescibacteria group bacterium]
MSNFKRSITLSLLIGLVAGALSGGATALILSGKEQAFINWFLTGRVTVAAPPPSAGPTVAPPGPSDDAATIAAVKKISPSVVSISISKTVSGNQISPFDDFFREFGEFGLPVPQPQPKKNAPAEKREVGGGTGFVVAADGLIMTNRHVVEDKDAEYTVILADGAKLKAKVVDTDLVEDVAVLAVEKKDLTPVTFGDSAKLEIGQTVIAIGNALSEFRNTVTKGVVSGVNRRLTAGGSIGGSEVIEGAIQTDAAINFGNSGGPLVNLGGEVIGMNTAVAREAAAEGIGFAIPANALKKIVASVQEHGKIVRPRLGVQYVLIEPKLAKKKGLPVDYGALIVRGETATDLAVIPGSPADKAGLVENDIILEVNGERVDDERSLGGYISRHEPGDTLTLKVYHKGETKEVTVILDEWKK